MKKYLNKKGFTLVELIVVIAIIAVLVVVGIPAIAGQVAKAKEAAAAANIRMIVSAYSVAMAEVDVDIAKDRLDISKGSTDSDGVEIFRKIINVVGTKFENKFRIVAHMSALDANRGLFNLEFTDKDDIGTVNEVYHYFGGSITKGESIWNP